MHRHKSHGITGVFLQVLLCSKKLLLNSFRFWCYAVGEPSSRMKNHEDFVGGV